MKVHDIIAKIMTERGPEDQSGDSLDWAIRNDGRYFALFKSAIEESTVETCNIEMGNKLIRVNKIPDSNIFIIVANHYARNKRYKEALELFKSMYDKGCNESTLLNDYGAALLNQLISEGATYSDKAKLDRARELIFEAFKFDKETSLDYPRLPAYKNLCFLRNMEARFYRTVSENFTAFALGWMSIEMSISRIWFQYISSRITNISKEKRDGLMRWNIDHIIEVLFLVLDDPAFKQVKPILDSLRGTRNKLLHGEQDNPTEGETELCINAGYQLIPILQSG